MVDAYSAPWPRPALAANSADLSDAEFAELDELLAAVPEPLDPLDVVMLDGFLCGVIIQPELLAADAWLPYVFDAGGHRWGAATPEPEQLRARALIERRHAALNRSLAEFGGFDPFVLEPSADGPDDAAPHDPLRDVLAPWVIGFEQALHLFPGLVDLDEPAVETVRSQFAGWLPADAMDAPVPPAAATLPSTAAMPAQTTASTATPICAIGLGISFGRPCGDGACRSQGLSRRGHRPAGGRRRRPLRPDRAAALQGRGGAPRRAQGRPQRAVPVRQRPQVQAMPRRARRRLMRLQLLSDLHLETETVLPQPAPGAELLVLAGDVDSRWLGLERFRDWPVPVLFVAGNHEFDGRDLAAAWPALRARCTELGLTLLERDSLVCTGADGRRVRFLGSTRWSDYDLFGAARRAKAMRAGTYFLRLMAARIGDRPLDVEAMREEALACRAWLAGELARPRGEWDRTVVVTHFAPSLRSADPRFGAGNGTASFCNADDDLLPLADLWLHGHLHCAHDYRVAYPGGSTRVVCNSRGHERRGEAAAHRPQWVIEV